MKPIDFYDPATQRAFSLTSTLLVDFPGIEPPVAGAGLTAQAINSILSPYLAGPALLDLFRAWRPLNSDDGWRVEPNGERWIDVYVWEDDEEIAELSLLIQGRPYKVRIDHAPTIFTLVLPLLPERKAGGDVHNYRHTGRAAERRFDKAWHNELVKRRMHLMKARRYGLTCVGMSGATYSFDPSPIAAIHLVNALDEAAFANAMKSDLSVRMSVE